MIVSHYGETKRVFKLRDFPAAPPAIQRTAPDQGTLRQSIGAETSVVDRARRYLAAIPPAVTGQHGDVDTFRVCCRLVRGFALDDDDALAVLRQWNLKCEPPWSETELRSKLGGARRYGREPIGSLLASSAKNR